MPFTIDNRPSHRAGHRLLVLKPARGSMMTLNEIATAAQEVLMRGGAGQLELLVTLQLPGLGPRTPGGGYVRDGVLLQSLIFDPDEYDGVDFADGSAGEHPIGKINSASFLVRRIRR